MSTGAPRAARAVGRAFTSGPALGVAWLGALTAIASRRPITPDDRVLGRDAELVSRFVQEHYARDVTRAGVAIGAFAVAVGVALGAFASGLVALRAQLREEDARRGWPGALERLAVVVGVHAWIVLGGMARAPQLYDEAWYARGGGARTVQVIATDVLGPSGVALAGLAVLAWYLAWAPESWARWGEQARTSLTSLVPPPLRRSLMPPPLSGALSLALVAGAASLLAFGLEACAPRAAAGAPSDHPNVVILAVDSLRADRLSPRTAPHLWDLAARGTRFERAYVSIPRTFPSWVTILTGRHAHHHGVRSMFPRWEDRARNFDALPARLAKAGYATGVVSDSVGDVFRRVDLGFDLVDTPTFDLHVAVRERAVARETPLLPFFASRLGRRLFPAMRDLPDAADPEVLADDAVAAIDRLRAGPARPFFLTVFFGAAHFPYAAPSPWYARFTGKGYRGRFKYDAPASLARTRVDDDDVAQVRGLYDGAVASVDAAVARVLTAIDKRGLRDRTVVVVTADHGESLYENGRGRGHGDHLYGDEGTHVPLVVVDPRVPASGAREPRVASDVARDVDLAPTLYALTGVPAPRDLDGRSLAPATRGEAVPSAFAYAESELWLGEVDGVPDSERLPYPSLAALTEVDRDHGDEIVLRRDVADVTTVARHRMIRDDRWKLVYAPSREGAHWSLYDTKTDPDETHDVAASHPDEAMRLEAELWKWMLEDEAMTRRNGVLVPRDGRKAVR